MDDNLIYYSVKYNDLFKPFINHKYAQQMFPFVGDHYDPEKYGILFVGESSFTNNINRAPECLNKELFDKWWDPNSDLYIDKPYYFDAKNTINSFINGYDCNGEKIEDVTMDFIAKALITGYNNKNKDKIYDDDLDYRQILRNIAFTNFYQIPSFIEAKSIDISFKQICANSNVELLDLYHKANAESTKILNGIIEVLQPKAIVFLSTLAFEGYKTRGKVRRAGKIKITNIPNPLSNWSGRNMALTGGLDGTEFAAQVLSNLSDFSVKIDKETGKPHPFYG